MEDMKILSGLESHGQSGSFKGKIFIDSKKFDELPEETRNKISFDASNFLRQTQESIGMEWAKINDAKSRQAHADDLKKIFEEAGWEVGYVDVIDSEYCSQSCCYKFPWIIVTTGRGKIKLGWRKRVMNLDWSDTDLDVNGMELFSDEDVTKSDHYIHCWGREKAVEYLTRLRKAVWGDEKEFEQVTEGSYTDDDGNPLGTES